MELIKQNIHMNRLKSEADIQITLDDDFNISDTKPDVERIIKNQGNIIINEMKVLPGKVNIKGALEFNILYFGSDNEINSMMGKIPFDENINMDEIDPHDIVNTKYELEDLSTTLVNSRKVSVKALVIFKCIAEEMYDEETAVSTDDDKALKSISKLVEITQIAINKKDIFRIKEEIVIPSSKKNIYELLYSDISLLNTEFRLNDGQIGIKGEVMVFALYLTEEGDFDYIEKEIPFSGNIELSESSSDMIDNIRPAISSKVVTAKPDEDGEERILDIDVTIDLDIKAYVEDEIEVLKDIYSVKKDIKPVINNVEYECLKVKNSSKCRVGERVKIDNTQPEVLQICNSTASAKIDDMNITDEGIVVDGAVIVQILYISGDDANPLNAIETMIPYSQLIEVKQMNENSIYDISPGVEHIGVVMLGNREVEIKCALNLDAIVFDRINEPVITDIEIKDFDADELNGMPGIVGYIVKEGDSLWSIAKKFHSTVDKIRENNSFDKSEVSAGDKLLIVKEVSI